MTGKKFFIKFFKSPVLYLSLIAAVFFVLYSASRFRQPLINSSPDEAANYFFTKLYAEEGVLSKYEPLDEGIAPVVHQRSINVNPKNYLVPGSFLGIILIYGFISKIFGSGIIIFLTPLFAALSSLFFYGIVKKIFSKKIAFISAILMLSHPVFFYYSTRSMFHNVLFISLLMMGVYFLLVGFAGEKNMAKSEHSHICQAVSALKIKQKNAGILPPPIARGQNEAKKRKIKNLFIVYAPILLAGFFIGLALIVRTSEAPWIIGMFLLLWIFYFRRVRLFKVFIILSMIFAVSLSVIYFNQILYGNPLISGYADLQKRNSEQNLKNKNEEANTASNNPSKSNTINISVENEKTKTGEFLQRIKKSVSDNMPAGLAIHYNPRLALNNFNNYFVNFFPLLSEILFISLIVFCVSLIIQFILLIYGRIKKISVPAATFTLSESSKEKPKIILFNCEINKKSIKKKFLYFLIFLSVSFYLAIYYGSWVFYDTPNTNLITLGTSYTRYWLPIYLMSLPFAAYLFVKISEVFKYKFPKFVFLSVILTWLVIYNIFSVFYAPYEGLKKQAEGAEEYNYKKEKVVALTPVNAVIVNQYYDKLFFPARKVIASKMYDDEGVKKSLSSLVKRVPIYYYSFGLRQDDIDFINRKYLESYNLKLGEEIKIFKNESLWKMESIK